MSDSSEGPLPLVTSRDEDEGVRDQEGSDDEDERNQETLNAMNMIYMSHGVAVTLRVGLRLAFLGWRTVARLEGVARGGKHARTGPGNDEGL